LSLIGKSPYSYDPSRLFVLSSAYKRSSAQTPPTDAAESRTTRLTLGSSASADLAAARPCQPVAINF
jgi:hypothetical protein